ncbi:HNH endonuclease signature motif containing protein [Mycolicibacterium rutilum]
MSVGASSIEHMYDPAYGATDADLITFMGEEVREESAALGRRWFLVAELAGRRFPEMVGRQMYCADSISSVAAEISPVLNISHSRAVWQVETAITLRDRHPQVFKRLCRGLIDYRMVSMIVSRTDNVADDVMVELDEAMAGRVEKWMKLSKNKLRDRIDLFIAEFDPAAVRVPPDADKHRYIDIDPGDTAGTAFVSGRLHAEDGAALDQRLDALADTVCSNDPRTKSQRRADACGPLARGEATLACQCGLDDCPARANRAAANAAVIHVLAEQGTIAGTSDKPGYLPGFGVLPAQSVRNLLPAAQTKPVTVPTVDTAAQTGYRPNAKLTEFLRWRDLTCRWPGCDKPVQRCDIDHTVPWPYGPTHPSNTKHYCRIHHITKTFNTGAGGFTDEQLPDGTIVLTTPTGHIYRSQAHGASMFPALRQPTGTVETTPLPPESPDRIAMMPRRRQTREQDRRERIATERRKRTEIITEQQRQHQAWLAATYEPPPF